MNGLSEGTMRDRTFDRLRRSIDGQKADGHSVFYYYTYPFFNNVTNVNLNEYFHNPKATFEAQLQALEMLDKCGSFGPDEGAVAECSALGGEVRFDSHGFISVCEAPINDLDDVLKLKPGDPYGDNYMRRALEQLEYMLQNAPKDIGVNPPVLHGPFTVAAQLRGISQFCMDTMLEPDLCYALLDVCAETSINFMKAAQKLMGGKLRHILVGDDISAFLGKEQYREWVMPAYKKLFDAFPGVQMWLHNDAGAGHLGEEIAEAGWAAWQYAPSIDPLKMLRDTGGKVSLLGGLDPVQLQTLTEEETYALCVERLKYFGGDTKCVLGPGGSVNQVPIANMKAILRAADEYKIPAAV